MYISMDLQSRFGSSATVLEWFCLCLCLAVLTCCCCCCLLLFAHAPDTMKQRHGSEYGSEKALQWGAYSCQLTPP